MPFRQPTRLLLKCLVAGAALLLGAPQAQAEPGDHLRAGNLTVIPQLGVGLRYRSNAFRSESDPQGTGIGLIRPGVQANFETPDVQFQLGGSYTINKYLFLSGNPTPEVRRERISRLDRFDSFNVNAGLQLLRTSPVGLSIDNRTTLRNNPSDIDPNSDDPYTTQLRNGFNAGIVIRPGPALEMTPGFLHTWSQFYVPDNEAERIPFNVRNAYGPTLNVRWKFLPRTDFIVNGMYLANRWGEQEPTAGGGVIAINDSDMGRLVTGIQGRLTERLRLITNIGYGFGNYRGGVNLSNLNGILAVVQADYKLTEDHTVVGGYRKTFFDSFFTNSVAANALYAGWNAKFGSSLTTGLQLATRFESYDGPITRQDQFSTITANVQYDLTSWSNLTLHGGWMQRASDNPTAEYDDIHVHLMANVQY